MLGCKRMFRILSPFVFIGTSSIAAEVPGPAVLQPLGKWQADYGNEECRIIRSFGQPDDRTVFQLAKFDPNPDLAPAISIVSNNLKERAATMKVTVSVEGQGKRDLMTGIVISAGNNVAPVLYIQGAGAFADLMQADIDAKRPTIVSFDSGKTHLKIALGKMDGPIRALTACMDDLLRSWGLDPQQQHSLKSKAMPLTSPTTWFNSSDYPSYLSSNMKTGGVIARVNISDTGEITGCHVMQAGGDKSFEELTCGLARKNGRFRPAISRDGKPIASYSSVNVLWKMP